MIPSQPPVTDRQENACPASFLALVPFLVFLLFYLGLSIWAKDFYKVPMPVAFLVASASAFLLNKKNTLAEKMEIYAKGMGENNIMIMCLIFILAGAFAATAKAAGAVDATVLISRHFIPDALILPELFCLACFISLAIGTSCGTIAALTPIAAGMITSMGLSPALALGAVIGGAMFGDNMSMISDTTIAATRTQGVAMRDKFIMNFKMILPAAVLTVLIYLFTKTPATVHTVLPPLSWKHFLATTPYLLILAGALAGLNVMMLLFLGTVFAALFGICCTTLTFWDALGNMGKGSLGMAETLIVAILAGGLLGMIRYNGGIRFLLEKIQLAVKGKYGCEAGVMFLVGLVNLFTANNTVAIVIAGPVAKDLSEKYKCDPRRIASILDTASCAVQGLIPYGAQILIAMGIASGSGIKISSLALVGSLYYPFLLGAALLISIFLPVFFKSGKTK
ncbi:MAG: Na+/H+ antiporter NhaC family protein [Lentisphaeria bacterium]|nr:Na+/H+ antiporter NhaC family protein [Lentisphaeria bacterium]